MSNHDPVLLFLLNPGRQSRHYLLALARAARELDLAAHMLELAPIWNHFTAPSSSSSALADRVIADLARLVRRLRITHTLGYIYNGLLNLPLLPSSTGPTPLFPALGLRHLALWTDHPEWATDGSALRPADAAALSHPNITHLLKSADAAAEAAALLRWPNAIGTDMAEEPPPNPPRFNLPTPSYDAVAIVADIGPVPLNARPFLDHPDPDPAQIDLACLPEARAAFEQALLAAGLPTNLRPEALSVADRWLAARIARPLASFHELAADLPPHPLFEWLHADPRRWYAAVQALRRMVGWRRPFMLAWLGRRLKLGLFGSDATPLDLPPHSAQPAHARNWVPYDQQPAVYAQGRVALNFNAAHDETGLTHKPFQIAAARRPLVHGPVARLPACFTPDQEVLTAARPAELLGQIHDALAQPARAAELAEAAHQRFRRDHTWAVRLSQWLKIPNKNHLSSSRILAGAATPTASAC